MPTTGLKHHAEWPFDSGEASEFVRNFDWSGTSLGPSAEWLLSLKSAVTLILDSPLAMIVLWGPELIQIYNDGYRDILGPLHPRAMGQPARESWPAVWEFSQPIYRAVFCGESRVFHNQMLQLGRSEEAQQAWFDLTYSPIRDAGDRVAGVLVTIVETTARHISNEALRLSLLEKDALLQEVHHRVKNNLEVIDSLLALQAASVQDDRVRLALSETSNRIHAIADIHRLLWATTDSARVSISPFLGNLVERLSTLFGVSGRINFVLYAEPLSLAIRQAVPLGLILNELFSNAAKHAFPDGRTGTVSVQLQSAARRIHLRVSDDGIGMPQRLPAGSLGLKLVRVLAEQLGGSVNFESPAGATAHVEFPAA